MACMALSMMCIVQCEMGVFVWCCLVGISVDVMQAFARHLMARCLKYSLLM